jgi:hypothetical protein
MKKLILLSLLIPFIAAGQTASVIASNRVFPKNDKIMEFEKALKNHAQKYHTGNWKWRVYTIESGPDAGGYHIIEGPVTWDQVDNRGDLGADHMSDWNKNVMPLTMDKNTMNFMVFREDLSSVKLTDYSDKIAVNHVFPKPGKSMDTENNIKLAKKVWEASDQNVAVYEASSSGPGQYLVVTRYKQGLKERETGFRKPLKERFTSANGEGSFDKWMTAINEDTDKSWAEMLFYSADLSSK